MAARGRWFLSARPGDLWLLAAIVFVAVLALGLAERSPLEPIIIVFEAVGVASPVWGLVLIGAALGAAFWFFALRWILRGAWHEWANRHGVEAPAPLHQARVIDGDTIHDLGTGMRYRLANIDAPETGEQARCAIERIAGECAGRVAHSMVRSAKRVEVRRTWRHDRWGRRVAFVLVDGADLGELLMARGLARPWRGRRVRWCGREGGFAQMAKHIQGAPRCGRCGAKRPWF